MNLPDSDVELDEILNDALASHPKADFETWQRQHPEAGQWLMPEPGSPRTVGRRRLRRAAAIAAAAAVLVCVWLGSSRLATDGNGGSAFAQTVEKILNAKSASWKVTRYWYGKDGKRSWVRSELRCAYKAPGLYREVELDEKGDPETVRIHDAINHKELDLYYDTKRARLEELATQSFSPIGPFHGVSVELKEGSLQWVGKRETATGKANVFRTVSASDKRPWSYDIWIDQETKRLVRQQIPSTDIFDPDDDPARNDAIAKNWPNGSPVCHILHDIVFDAELDDSLFSFDPPEDFKVEVIHRNFVTEQEMIDYMGIVARANGGKFPGLDYPGRLSLAFPDHDWYDVMRAKPEAEWTAAEKELQEVIGDAVERNLNHLPIYHFITDNADRESFRYLGKGVRYGDESGIICWYRLNGAKTYRVVHGDLHVEDVAPQDLPLPISGLQ